MKLNTFFYQLLIRSGYRVSAIAVSIFLATQGMVAPVVAQQQGSQSQQRDLTERLRQPAEPQQASPSQQADMTELLSGPTETSETAYTLGPGDRINLNIFQVEEYSGEYPILVDGTISLPLVGKVRVSDLTLKEAEQTVSEKYSLYLKRPIVTVGLVSPRPMNVTIAGEVNNPGAYKTNFAENPQFPTAIDMIRQAGGITTLADIRNIQITRKFQGREQVYNVNAWTLFEQGRLADLRLRDGDTVFIPTVKEINLAEIERLASAGETFGITEPIEVAMVGEIYRPGTYKIAPGGTANNAAQGQQNQQNIQGGNLPPRLSDALRSAGGIKPLANIRKIEIQRQTWDGQARTINVDLWELLQSGKKNQDLILQEGDTIVIPQADKIAEEDAQQIAAASFSPNTIRVNVVGEVKTPGPVEVPPNTPLNQAILAAGGFDQSRASKGSVELVRLNPNGTVSKREIDVDFAENPSEENNPTLHNNDVVVVGRSGTAVLGDAVGAVLSPFLGPFGFIRSIFR
ncbi:SLBB domain-containing protein [Pleurocapsales cyanobacterium LEGE 06147]|nr:SLBB domain-containing protein [Pleurocapsales cyanobacterium LEGE 06147]